MKKTTSLFLKCVFALQIISASTLYANNPTKEDSLAKICFYSAKTEIENMLSGKIPLDYERAVFITENAYWENKFDYNVFKNVLSIHTNRISNLVYLNYNDSIQNLKPSLLETIDEKKLKYKDVLTNWAIFKYITDTTYYVTKNKLTYNSPFQYTSKDPLSTTNWSNSQVLHLLAQEKGNCYALAILFKIFSERFNSNANIATAPGHIYIVHNDMKGAPYNIELASRAFPGSGSIKAFTNTTHEAVVNGISLRTLNLKQSVSLCLVYLAKGYENKFNSKSDEFILQCAQTTLKYDSLNLNAMLLKAEVFEERIINKNKSIVQLQNDRQFKEYEKLIASLYKKGYREMPIEIKNLIISRMQNDTTAVFIAKDQTPNPFKHIKSDPKDTRYATLSWGLFDEIHETKPFEQYSRTIFDTKKQKISKFSPTDTLYNNYNFDPVVFAWNIDPLAHKYVPISPYSFALNNPIYFTDNDGRVVYGVDGKPVTIGKDDAGKPVIQGKPDAKTTEIFQALIKTPRGIKAAEFFTGAAEEYKFDLTDKQLTQGGKLVHGTTEETGDNVFTVTISTAKHGKVKNAEGKEVNERFETATKDELINAVGVHEETHMSNNTDEESKPVQDELQSRTEFNLLNPKESSSQSDYLQNYKDYYNATEGNTKKVDKAIDKAKKSVNP
ncbi:MAG: hypothetical protein WC223_12945 [Bacteroidales bacterium]|jgi:hypothetical protein